MNYKEAANKISKTLFVIAFFVWNIILSALALYGNQSVLHYYMSSDNPLPSDVPDNYYIFYYLSIAIQYYVLGLLIYISYYVLKVWGIIDYLKYRWLSYRLHISEQKLIEAK